MPDIPAGTYDLYLWLPDRAESLRSDPRYSVRLANLGMWDSDRGWNDLGASVTIGSAPSSEPLSYPVDTDGIFFNPERGPYTPPETGEGGYSFISASTLNFVRDEQGTQIARWGVNIRDYRDTDTIAQSYLDNLQTDLNTFRDNGFKIIVRFKYDVTGSSTNDVPWARMEQHIDQLAAVFNANNDVVMSYEAGFVGRWGEWHGSTNYGSDWWPESNWTALPQVLQKLCNVLHDRPIALRFPRHIRYMINENGTPRISPEHLPRLAFYNDSFMADPSDWGTYNQGLGPTDQAFIANWIVGRSMCGEHEFDDSYNDAYRQGRFGDFATYRWTSLRYSHTGVEDMWRATSHPTEPGTYWNVIERRLGYRLQLNSAVVPTGATDSLDLTLRIQNVGWAAPISPRPVFLVLRNGSSDRLFPLDIDLTALDPAQGEVTYNLNVPLDENGNGNGNGGDPVVQQPVIDTVSGNVSQSSPLSWPHTTSGDANRLYVAISIYENNPATVTYDGQPLTAIESIAVTVDEQRWELWELVDPPAGTANIVVTAPGADTWSITGVAASVERVSNVVASAINAGSGTGISHNIASDEDGLIVSFGMAYNANLTLTGGTVLLQLPASPDDEIDTVAAGTLNGTGANVSVQWINSFGHPALATVSLAGVEVAQPVIITAGPGDALAEGLPAGLVVGQGAVFAAVHGDATADAPAATVVAQRSAIVSAGTGDANADGVAAAIVTAVAVTLAAGVADALAEGLAAAVDARATAALQAVSGDASADGQAATVVTGQRATITATVADAVADATDATVVTTQAAILSGAVASAEAEGLPAAIVVGSGVTLTASVGEAAAAGGAAEVVTHAEAVIQAAPGDATADGVPAGVVTDASVTIAATTGDATAEGLLAIVAVGGAAIVTATVGESLAEGSTADVVTPSAAVIVASAGEANAEGRPAAVLTDQSVAIVATVAEAQAQGLPAAIVAQAEIVIQASPADALADGIAATVRVGSGVEITASVGVAVAAGQPATIDTGTGATLIAHTGSAAAEGLPADVITQADAVLVALIGDAIASGLPATIDDGSGRPVTIRGEIDGSLTIIGDIDGQASITEHVDGDLVITGRVGGP